MNKYKLHKISGNSLKDASLIIKSVASSADQKLINEQVSRVLDYLENLGVSEFSPFHQLFRANYLKSKDITSFILWFQFKLRNENHIHLFCLKNRELEKSNNGIRNIVINRLAAEFPDEIIDYAKIHFRSYYKSMENIEGFLETFESYVNKLREQIKNEAPKFLNHSTQNQTETQTPSIFAQNQTETQTPSIFAQNQTETQTPDPLTQNQTNESQLSDFSTQNQTNDFSFHFDFEVDKNRVQPFEKLSGSSIDIDFDFDGFYFDDESF